MTHENSSSSFESVLEEKRTFPPSAEFSAQAHIKSREYYNKLYQASLQDPGTFWAQQSEALDWIQPWEQVLDTSKKPFYKWFVGGQISVSANCVDRHIAGADRNKAALIFEGEMGDTRVLTYFDLYREVNRCANVLKQKGIRKGDRVAIYLPMIPELAIAVLACARIGAVHSVIFAGFSADAIRDRIQDMDARCVITADYGWRRGRAMALKSTVDRSLEGLTQVATVLVVQRGGATPEETLPMQAGRDVFWDACMAEVEMHCPPEPMDSEDLLFLLYTSGTTGKPKGIMHTQAGYLLQAQLTSRYIFDLKPEDVFWCTADIGWITGHSYLVYGPLANGATVLMYEGAPNYPDASRFWHIIEKYGVSIFYTAPTAIRYFMKMGVEYVEKHDLSSLRLLGSVGEPINPEAWMWYHQVIGQERCPIVDTWWQTETGGIMLAPIPGVTATKPGSACLPFFGVDAAILDVDGQECDAGILAIRQPWPGMTRGVYGDPQRFKDTYWSHWDGAYYLPGDGARKDADGLFWILGRIDDVVNVSGHRIGTAELESAFVEHISTSEAAVVAIPHAIKGQGLIAFITLKNGHEPTPELSKELNEWIAQKIGKFAVPELILFARDLPKTRSGKIMRRVLRAIAEGSELGNVTTLADPSVVEELQTAYQNACSAKV
jgi:acetyl-CoA synthetase